jgi:hypothetical protein
LHGADFGTEEGRQRNSPNLWRRFSANFWRRFLVAYVETSGFSGIFDEAHMFQTSIGSRPWSKLMRTREASAYLADVHGILLSEATLNKLRCVGGGPKYFKDGRYPGYTSEFLDAFAQARLGTPRTSTSDTGGKSAP